MGLILNKPVSDVIPIFGLTEDYKQILKLQRKEDATFITAH
jgi:hypothetical protein